MGREVKRVPPDWEHPRRADGKYQPMHMELYRDVARKWMADAILWDRREHPDQQRDDDRPEFFWEWEGEPPEPKYYRHREWTEEEATHWQMYETTSEGTPISPVMESPEALARWLADNNASTFADMTTTYENWLAMIRRGWAPSAVFSTAGMQSGVEATAQMSTDKSE